MNRRDFLKHAFQLGAAGLILPATEPIRRYWQLDRTMLPRHDPHALTDLRHTLTVNVGSLNEFVQWREEVGPGKKPALTLEYLEREIRAIWESAPAPEPVTYWIGVDPGNTDFAQIAVPRLIPVERDVLRRLADGRSYVTERLPASDQASIIIDKITMLYGRPS